MKSLVILLWVMLPLAASAACDWRLWGELEERTSQGFQYNKTKQTFKPDLLSTYPTQEACIQGMQAFAHQFMNVMTSQGYDSSLMTITPLNVVAYTHKYTTDSTNLWKLLYYRCLPSDLGP